MNLRNKNARKYASKLVLEHGVANDATLDIFSRVRGNLTALGMKGIELTSVCNSLGICKEDILPGELSPQVHLRINV